LSHEELHRTLSTIAPGSFKHVKCSGLLGMYDDGFAWTRLLEHASRPKVVFSLHNWKL
jgi:hypothetical protein